MKLGTRWGFGAQPPTGLPEAVKVVMQEVEDSVREDTPHVPAAAAWTLTWLEGLPVTTLDVADGSDPITITVSPLSGEPVVGDPDPSQPDDVETW